MSLYNSIQKVASPLMVMLVFVILILTKRFELSSAFTIMYQYNYLSYIMTILPFVLTLFVEAQIA